MSDVFDDVLKLYKAGEVIDILIDDEDDENRDIDSDNDENDCERIALATKMMINNGR